MGNKFIPLLKDLSSPEINGTIKTCTVEDGTILKGDFVTFKKIYSPRVLRSMENLRGINVKKINSDEFFFVHAQAGASGSYYCTAQMMNTNGSIGPGVSIASNIEYGPALSSYTLSNGRLLLLSRWTYWWSFKQTHDVFLFKIDGMTLTQLHKVTVAVTDEITYSSSFQLSDDKVYWPSQSGGMLISVKDDIITTTSVSTGSYLTRIDDTRLFDVTNKEDGMYLKMVTISDTVTTSEPVKIMDAVYKLQVLKCTLVSSNKYILFVSTGTSSSSNYTINAIFLTVGDSITVTKTSVLKFDYYSSCAIYELSSTKLLFLANCGNSVTTQGNAVILNLSSSSITEGTELKVSDSTRGNFIVFSESLVLLIRYGKAIIYIINNTTLTKGQEVVFQYDPEDNTYTYTIECSILSSVIKNNTLELMYYISGTKEYFSKPYKLKVVDLIVRNNNIVVNETYRTLNKVYKAAVVSAIEGVAKNGGSASQSVEVYTIG